MGESLAAVSLLGVPYDAHSSFLRGPAGAPAAVRAALTCGSANWCTERGTDLDPAKGARWQDRGDLDLPDEVEPALAAIRAAAADAIADGGRLVSIGGDHLVTWPLVQAMTEVHEGLTILHFDAHPDLYDELDGDRYSHACPFARIMEEGKVARLIQFGIRTMTPHQREQAERFGVEVHEARSGVSVVDDLSKTVYVSIDIDVLDPAYAPGISHHEPGGWSTRQLLDALAAVSAAGVPVVGADLVEINPTRDINEMTAMVGAKLIRELLELTLMS
ncbi:MAG: agmatinase [Acidimicrobiales bacterium]|nr:agmatinase [Acidimicrobiales bacterium]